MIGSRKRLGRSLIKRAYNVTGWVIMNLYSNANDGGGGVSSMNSSNKYEEDENIKMRRAFEEFMLEGKANKTSYTQHASANEQTSKLKEIDEQKQINQMQQEMKKGEKKYWAIFHKFCHILQSQWLDIDDQALEVIQSISGIRHRLPVTMKLLNRYKDLAMNLNSCDWKHKCHNQLLVSTTQQQSRNSLLQKDDVELALSHDLLQHEKMMEGLRSLFANLSEIHEALSRTLEEMMKHQLQQDEQKMNYSQYYSLLSTKSYLQSSSLVCLISDLFGMLSVELFRKQSMVRFIFNSADDRLFISSQEEKSDSQDDHPNLDEYGPKKIVNHCLHNWPRSCDESLIDNSVLAHVIDLHEKNHGFNRALA